MVYVEHTGDRYILLLFFREFFMFFIWLLSIVYIIYMLQTVTVSRTFLIKYIYNDTHI